MEKIDNLAVIDIKKRAAQMIKVNTDIRYGQAIFNAALEMFPNATNKLRNTKYDCYYDNSKILSFLNQLINTY